MRLPRVPVRWLIVALVAMTPVQPVEVSADPAPLGCVDAADPSGPAVGDGMTPGDAGAAATVLTYGCFDARLQDAADVDGYRIYGTPVSVSVQIGDDEACVHVTWFMGPPPSRAISRWLCGHEEHTVTWTGVHPMRLQLWHGPSPTMNGATLYRIIVWPTA